MQGSSVVIAALRSARSQDCTEHEEHHSSRNVKKVREASDNDSHVALLGFDRPDIPLGAKIF